MVEHKSVWVVRGKGCGKVVRCAGQGENEVSRDAGGAGGKTGASCGAEVAKNVVVPRGEG